MIYFDNGATTFPKPRGVVEAVHQAMTRYGANPGRSGHDLSIQTSAKVYQARESAAKLFGVSDPGEVVFTSNCTHAINIALKGLLQPGDHVILSDLEHNAVLRPVHALAQKGDIEYDIANTYADSRKTVDSFYHLIRPTTRLIVCTHASNVFGIRLPIEDLALLCREKNLFFLVDAAQSAGVLNLDAPCMGIDFLCTAGHKGLYGPSGTGLLITAMGNSLNTLMEGGTGSFSANYEQPFEMPDRLESGTVNTVGILGLGAGIRFVQEKGTAQIYRHEMGLAKEIFRQLKRIPQIELYTPDFEEGSHLPVLSFNIRGMASEQVTENLSRQGFALRGGLHCAPLAHKKMGTLEQGTVRISVGAFNTKEQALKLCDAIKKTCRCS
ncbi:MAG: aminotransferase class V-fold PLP-dependent enzyme [Oscillospiraceae bacterium]|jgi:cysteine desulfurase family protein